MVVIIPYIRKRALSPPSIPMPCEIRARMNSVPMHRKRDPVRTRQLKAEQQEQEERRRLDENWPAPACA